MGFDKSNQDGASVDIQRQAILEKIHALIDKADPDSWRHGGEPLSPEAHFEKPRRTWEEVYTQDLEKGTLVFRKSTPVTSQFLGRGFQLQPIGTPQYTVELRAVGWHHSELTDQNRRSQHSDRTCHVLAEGDIAAELLEHVEHSFANYHNTQQKEFDQQAHALVSLLPQRLQEETVDTWNRSEEVIGEVHYEGVVDNCKVDVYRTYQGDREVYGINVSQSGRTSKIPDPDLAKELYLAVEDLGQTSRLLTLSKALELL